jgi:hypothetical protein
VSAGEGRTVAELLDDSDGLAREALLDTKTQPSGAKPRGSSPVEFSSTIDQAASRYQSGQA